MSLYGTRNAQEMCTGSINLYTVEPLSLLGQGGIIEECLYWEVTGYLLFGVIPLYEMIPLYEIKEWVIILSMKFLFQDFIM